MSADETLLYFLGPLVAVAVIIIANSDKRLPNPRVISTTCVVIFTVLII